MEEQIISEIRDIFGDENPDDRDSDRNTDRIAAIIGKAIAEELINAGIFDRS